jgi:hypothetical protein
MTCATNTCKHQYTHNYSNQWTNRESFSIFPLNLPNVCFWGPSFSCEYTSGCDGISKLDLYVFAGRIECLAGEKYEPKKVNINNEQGSKPVRTQDSLHVRSTNHNTFQRLNYKHHYVMHLMHFSISSSQSTQRKVGCFEKNSSQTGRRVGSMHR